MIIISIIIYWEMIVMAESSEFEKFCIQILEKHIGPISGEIVRSTRARKNLNEKSSPGDYREFIDILENNISILSGKKKAEEIVSILRSEVNNLDAKLKKQDNVLNCDMEKEISTFLERNNLPAEKDVSDYSKYLTLKYGGNVKNVEKEIIDRIKIQIKKTINKKRISGEINELLLRFHEPTRNDIDDFINYLRLSKLSFNEDELREDIERERLFRKFHTPQDSAGASEISELVNFIKNTNNNDIISQKLRKRELSYLIKDDSGVSDKSVSDFVKLMTPTEEDTRDTLKELGLKHLITDK